jgi:hypothetical protein
MSLVTGGEDFDVRSADIYYEYIHHQFLPVKRPASPRCSVVALLSSL